VPGAGNPWFQDPGPHLGPRLSFDWTARGEPCQKHPLFARRKLEVIHNLLVSEFVAFRKIELESDSEELIRTSSTASSSSEEVQDLHWREGFRWLHVRLDPAVRQINSRFCMTRLRCCH
jgi:hypothetical protein